MDSVNQPSDKAPSLKTVAGLLAAINPGFNSDKAGSKQFAKYLSQSQASPSAQGLSHSQASARAIVKSDDELADLKKLAKALHRLLQNAKNEEHRASTPLPHKAEKVEKETNVGAVVLTPHSTSSTMVVDEEGLATCVQTGCEPLEDVALSDVVAMTTADVVLDEKEEVSSIDLLAALQALIIVLQKEMAPPPPPEDGQVLQPIVANLPSPVDVDLPTEDILLEGQVKANENLNVLTPAPAPQDQQDNGLPLSAELFTDAPKTEAQTLADQAQTDAILKNVLKDCLKLADLVAKQVEASAAQQPELEPQAQITLDAGKVLENKISDQLTSSPELRAQIKSVVDDIRAQLATPKPAPTQTAVGDQAALPIASDSVAPISIAKKKAPAVPGIELPKIIPQPESLTSYFVKPETVDGKTAVNASFVSMQSFNGGKSGDASLDFDMQSNGRNPSMGAPTNPLNNASLTEATNAPSATTPYSFASQLSASRATQGGTTGLPSPVEQVVLQLHRNVKSGNDQMMLQLNPAELGRVNIKLSIAQDGKVKGTVMADNPATLDMLLKDVRGLERALQDAGLRADPGSLQFSLSGQAQQNKDQGNGKTSSGKGEPQMDAALELATVAETETYYVTPGRVNLRV
ncbi:MAG: flagellar hook-length control protein FliK [Alphaproteobacteria bacterium]